MVCQAQKKLTISLSIMPVSLILGSGEKEQMVKTGEKGGKGGKERMKGGGGGGDNGRRQ